MQRTAPPAKTSMLASFGKAVLAIVLVVSLTPFVPTTAYADAQGTTIAEQLREANSQIEAQGFTTVGSQSYNWLEDEAPAAKARNAALPSSYDLRDAGVVTPVKLQNPWGTCWGFAAIAASETSILSELKNAGKDYSSSSPFYDLSERQLAWFAYSPIPANDPNGQGGEGQATMTKTLTLLLIQVVCRFMLLPSSLLALVLWMKRRYLTKMKKKKSNTSLFLTQTATLNMTKTVNLQLMKLSLCTIPPKVPGQ